MRRNMSGNLAGAIEDMLSGSVAGNIQVNTEGGGSDVTITPTLSEGTKIADFTIDDNDGSLYAPTPTEYTAGDNISIDNGVISADVPTYTAGANVSIDDGVISAVDTTYTAGEGISIDDGVISAEGGGATKVLLYQASADNDHPATITLEDSIDNYDFIEMNIDFYTNGRRYTLGYSYNCATLDASSNLGFDIGSGGNCWYSLGSDLKTLTFLQNSGSWHIANITGYKL